MPPKTCDVIFSKEYKHPLYQKSKMMTEEEHIAYHRRLIYVVVLILILLFGGATFYHNVEKWRYLDALYFASATMTTVGYGDITPKTDIGRGFTIIYVFASVSVALYGLTLLATHFVEVREKKWINRVRYVKGKFDTYHPRGVLQKIKNIFSYESGKIVEGHQQHSGQSIKKNQRKKRI